MVKKLNCLNDFILLLRCFLYKFFMFCGFLYLWNLFVKKNKTFKTGLRPHLYYYWRSVNSYMDKINHFKSVYISFCLHIFWIMWVVSLLTKFFWARHLQTWITKLYINCIVLFYCFTRLCILMLFEYHPEYIIAWIFHKPNTCLEGFAGR